MPLVPPQNYQPSWFFRNGHLSTIYQAVFRKIKGVEQQRERIELPDGDFLDLDWSHSNGKSKKVVILLHGLEGDGQRHYIMGSAKVLNQNGFDACALNFRGCSGEPNRLYRSYHSGAAKDLEAVIDHILTTKTHSEIFLMGFSLGGNLLLKYLGENETLPPEIKAGLGVSVPCDLKEACVELMKPKNWIYSNRFKKYLLTKLRIKQKLFPERITKTDIKSIKTLKDFDDAYTAPAHGFRDAFDYYKQCSCKQFLPHIKMPSLIINAENDTFLGQNCYPVKEAKENPNLHLEIPTFGGHVGFWGKQNVTYAEQRAVEFFTSFRESP
ncbi:alpha/beta fold hydrolase [Allomuricauda sp. d1]|uniref:YheT family hydrolase n=1 Tax=Allomuricauda sp. d1 TaxID=3136725 RepID=UPI0031D25EA9